MKYCHFFVIPICQKVTLPEMTVIL